MTQHYTEAATAAAHGLAERTGVPQHDVALVLGLGAGGRPWTRSARSPPSSSTTDLPGFAAPAVAGHAGTVLSVAGRRQAAPGLPRPHPPLRGPRRRPVVHGVRTAAAAGCKTVVLTNGCGGLEAGAVAGHSRC